MKPMNFQDDTPSIPVDNFKDHYVLVFDLTSMQDATEHCHHPKLIGEPLRLELYFSSPLENVTEVIVLYVFCCRRQVWCCGKESLRWIRLPFNKFLIVYLCSSIGTLDHFPQTLVQTFRMTRLRLSTHSLATRQESIGK